MTAPMSDFFSRSISPGSILRIAICAGASDLSVGASPCKRRSVMLAAPMLILWLGHKRVRSAFGMGWPSTRSAQSEFHPMT